MSKVAQELLMAFDALPIAERHEVAVEIFRRTGATEDVPEEALQELAVDLLQSYDAEEVGHAGVRRERDLEINCGSR